jgi:hypothetical protein
MRIVAKTTGSAEAELGNRQMAWNPRLPMRRLL